MPRKPNLERPTRLETKLPETLRARLDLLLFSELEGRVPKGRYQEFFIERILEFFNSRQLELEPLGFPQGYFVRGPKEMIDELERRLREWQTSRV
jgi:hypothetical protein